MVVVTVKRTGDMVGEWSSEKGRRLKTENVIEISRVTKSHIVSQSRFAVQLLS